MKGKLLLLSALLAAAPASAGEIAFATRPTAKREGGTIRVRFAVTAPTDVEVAILDARGKVVRHLAAGVLGGKNPPPPPLAAGLAQSLAWDRKDDSGRPVGGDLSGFKARVGLGLGARFNGIIGWSGQRIDAPRAMACGPDGTLYVIHGERFYGHRRTTLITAFDRAGRYVRQVFPGRGDLPPERREGWPRIALGDGSEVPVIFHVLTRCLYPGAYFGAGEQSNAAVTGDGRLVVLSGSATTLGTLIKYADVRGGRRLLILGIDGSVPSNFLGPLVAGPRVGGRGYVAVSPDSKYAYVSGMGAVTIWGKLRPAEVHNVVYRARLDASEKARPFIGKLREAGSGRARLNDPRGVDVDRAGNIYVADHGNKRIVVFTSAGKYLGEIPAPGATRILVSSKTGAVYAQVGAKLVKFGGLKAPVKQLERSLPTINKDPRHTFHMALDDSGPKPVLYLSCTFWILHKLERVVDEGDKFVSQGDPIAAHVTKARPGLPFVMNVAVTGGRLITRMPRFPDGNADSMQYDARTGKYLGLFRPKAPGGKGEGSRTLYFCGSEMTAGRDGRLYVQTGGFMWPARNSANPGTLRRYEADGRAAPFKALGKHFIRKFYHGHHRPGGMFITHAGDIYVAAFPGYRGRDQKERGMDIHVIGPDGKFKHESRVKVIGATVGGLAVDRKGNIYVGIQIWPKARRMPPWLGAKLPKSSRGHPARAYRQYGTIVKFPPTGGRVVPDPKGELIGHAGGYAGRSEWAKGVAVRLENALWSRRLGYVPINNTAEAGCQCESTRFDVDDYGRLFVPDLYRFRIAVLDGAGNEIGHFGGYGNMDNRGAGSKHPTPAIPYGWPIGVELAGDRVFVADLNNRRVVVARIVRQAEATCDVK